MFGLAARLIGGMFTPLIDQASASSARLLRKLALFLVAGLALLVVLIALTIAFDLWITSLKGPVVGALAVAGLYLIIAGVTIALALRPATAAPVAAAESDAATKPDAAAAAAKQGAAKQGMDDQVDAFAAPLLAMLQRLGLRKEQLAVLAGTSVAKQVGPIPLVGLAIVAGFLIGRMGRDLLSNELVASLLASDLISGLFGSKPDTPDIADEDRDAA